MKWLYLNQDLRNDSNPIVYDQIVGASRKTYEVNDIIVLKLPLVYEGKKVKQKVVCKVVDIYKNIYKLNVIKV